MLHDISYPMAENRHDTVSINSTKGRVEILKYAVPHGSIITEAKWLSSVTTHDTQLSFKSVITVL